MMEDLAEDPKEVLEEVKPFFGEFSMEMPA